MEALSGWGFESLRCGGFKTVTGLGCAILPGLGLEATGEGLSMEAEKFGSVLDALSGLFRMVILGPSGLNSFPLAVFFLCPLLAMCAL